MPDTRKQSFVLGLDLGVGSVGWALLGVDDNGKGGSLIHAGVHLFEAGTQGNIAEGRDESRAKPRRDARHMRRQIWRRARRKRHLTHVLQRCGLFPPGATNTPTEIDAYIKAIDKSLRDTWERKGRIDHRTAQLLPYRLRAEAIRRRLEPVEVGRALYHLAQRRGFLSMRKGEAKKDEDEGALKKAIAELDQHMRDTGAETLGEYFASLDPTDPDARRIRGRWTSRQMYEHEFDRIWTEQARHHPDMTDEVRRTVRRAIFHHRPLKSQRHLIGRCEITGKRKAPLTCRLAQRFRMLQKVNDLEIIPHERIEQLDPKSGRHKKVWAPIPRAERRKLDVEQRAAVLDLLERGDATFTDVRKALNLRSNMRFNFEVGGEKRLPGNRTAARLREIFGERWDALTDDEQDEIIHDLLGFIRKDALVRRGRTRWGLDRDAAEAFGHLALEEGYAAHSRQALRDLLAIMKDGTPYATAHKRLHPEAFEAAEPLDALPPVHEAIDNLTNPTVARALTELRKVVNAIIRRYGKPERVHIELARDLKLGRKRREEITRNIRQRQTERENAKKRILDELGYQNPSNTDVQKVLLADECGWRCPFTGRSFGMQELLGPTPQVDIEHVWPFSRSLDNSFTNKTLCFIDENRTRKRNRTPREAYGDDAERYEEILRRVRAFRSERAREKLKRFQAERIPEEFSERHLTESRYISRAAGEYLAVLYGGLWDRDGKRRIQVSAGQMTHWLRREWSMDAVLSENDEKNRADHRHHAIDAIVVAASTPRIVQVLQRAAEQASDAGSRRLFAAVQDPWEGFVEDVHRAVDAIVVSHRQDKRVRGPLHAESLYSRSYGHNGNRGHRIRKELHKLTTRDVDRIIHPAVRQAVHDKLVELGEPNPQKAFAEPANHPHLNGGDGRKIPIHKVRVQTSAKPRTVSRGTTRERHVASTKGSNHHTVIMARLDTDGSEKTWVDEPVTLDEAYNRMRRRAEGEDVSVFSRDVPPGRLFKFTLTANEYVEMDQPDNAGRAVYRVLSLSRGDNRFQLHLDGQQRDLAFRAGTYLRVSGDKLRTLNARKVHINHLGEVHDAGG